MNTLNKMELINMVDAGEVYDGAPWESFELLCSKYEIFESTEEGIMAKASKLESFQEFETCINIYGQQHIVAIRAGKVWSFRDIFQNQEFKELVIERLIEGMDISKVDERIIDGYYLIDSEEQEIIKRYR